MAAPFPPDPPNQPMRFQLPLARLPLNLEWVLNVALAVVLCYLLGPVVLLARRIKKCSSSSAWDADERQRSVKGSALLYLLFYIPVLLFRFPIAQIWSFIFSHLQLATWIAQAAIWPPTLSTILYRWLLALPLVYLLAYILLCIDEFVVKIRREPVRILLPEELAQLSTPGTKQKTATKRARRSALTYIRSNRKPLSLWEQIDWNQVPDDDPLKQAVIEEAERNAVERYTQRVQAEVQHALQRQQIEPNTPAQSNTSEGRGDYDWNSGEGTLKL